MALGKRRRTGRRGRATSNQHENRERTKPRCCCHNSPLWPVAHCLCLKRFIIYLKIRRRGDRLCPSLASCVHFARHGGHRLADIRVSAGDGAGSFSGADLRAGDFGTPRTQPSSLAHDAARVVCCSALRPACFQCWPRAIIGGVLAQQSSAETSRQADFQSLEDVAPSSRVCRVQLRVA